MKPEELADQVELVVISRGALSLSDGQKDILLKAAKKLRRLDSDDGKELLKLREELRWEKANSEEMRADYHV